MSTGGQTPREDKGSLRQTKKDGKTKEPDPKKGTGPTRSTTGGQEPADDKGG